jgi:hypothetical protein
MGPEPRYSDTAPAINIFFSRRQQLTMLILKAVLQPLQEARFGQFSGPTHILGIIVLEDFFRKFAVWSILRIPQQFRDQDEIFSWNPVFHIEN